MLEILFLIALVSWAVVSTLEFLAGLPAAGTLAAAALVIPLLTTFRFRRMARASHLELIGQTRRPVPPERFFWPAERNRLGWHATRTALAAAVSWPAALLWPAQQGLSTVSVSGWMTGTLAIIATSEAVAAGWLYIKASQRFNRLKPGFIGWLRRALYKLSDNHEFLGEEPLPRRKKQRESVY
jgi:hypothetical protein